MNILAMDTSGAAAAFAALRLQDGQARVEGYAEIDNMRSLSQHLIARLQSTLDGAGWTLRDVDALAVSVGPGSWTGLRIGVTTMKTLAQSLQLPIAGVPVFDALAQSVWRRWNEEYSLPEHGLLLTVAPCRPGEVYGKLFECHPNYLGLVQPEWIGAPEMMVGTLAAEALAREVETTAIVAMASAPAGDIFSGDEVILPNASLQAVVVEVGLAGAALLEAGEASDALALTPLYLAPSAAERNLLAKKKS